MRPAADKSIPKPQGQTQALPQTLFKAVFNHAADGMVILDQWRQVLYMNPAARSLLGTEFSERSFCGDLFKCHDNENGTFDDERCFGQCVLSSKIPVEDIEMNITDSKGNDIPVAVTYSYIPFENENPYLLMSIRDISERKRLEEAQRHNNELQYTLQERERLARDLHDGVVQDIAYANMQTKSLLDELENGHTVSQPELSAISNIMERSFTDLRQAIYDLTFRISDDFSAYVKRYVLDYGVRYKILSHVTKTHDIPRVDPFVATQAVKIMQEALANVRKHAEATEVDVSLQYLKNKKAILLEVSDNGKGFETQDTGGCEHYGMTSMRERANLIEGRVTVDSAIGQGTKVMITIPVVSS
ncbi:PAS domain-containing sensor histidine kinase [Alicyclobacillus sp. SO9]|uniref:sensor histidine kinase n=1 Tax=Alicyclobacillus sp. SO9 TaxID=2665646 RepID=UPI0018E8C64B|nr:PAS domain-containing sensor histidine kinase [Alicyclobacillus sp. SO9]QQE77794.1 PAS domain S-box protein [Alicyclobacillus sp. SO9]